MKYINMIAFFLYLYVHLRVTSSIPVKKLSLKTTSTSTQKSDDTSIYKNAKPKFDHLYDDEEGWDDDDDWNDDVVGEPILHDEAVYHEPKRRRHDNIWKYNLNKTQGDEFIFQGDIRLTPLQKVRTAPIFEDSDSKRKRRAARSKEPEYLWRYNTIYYKIDNNFDRQTKRAIKRGIRQWKKTMKNCLKFIRLDRDPELEKRVSKERFGGGPVHHILLTRTDTGCWSNVGRVDTHFQNQPVVFGRQVISIGDGCGEKGTVVHEIGHAIGFWHEQSRRDRDSFVKIMKNNILYGQKEQFKRMAEKQVGSMGFAYDFWSVMHYGPLFFSKNGKPTIRVQKEYRYLRPNMGQRNGLSYLDIAQVRAMYKCNALPSRESKRVCLNKKTKGSDYRGTLDYTRGGIMCQPWDKQYPHKHNYRLYRNGIGKHNFCRNPGGEKDRPWCFTTLGKGEKVWDYCDLDYCDS